MASKRILALIAVLIFSSLIGGSSAAQLETQAEHDARMAWWREARFGLFIHWGLYAVPAGEWNGKTNYGEWIRNNAQIPLAVYDKFVGQFNPVKFDADAWVRMAKDAGMKYIVITSKHHDGFALFDSKVSDFDVMATPFKRDILKELAAACKEAGLGFGIGTDGAASNNNQNMVQMLKFTALLHLFPFSGVSHNSSGYRTRYLPYKNLGAAL